MAGTSGKKRDWGSPLWAMVRGYVRTRGEEFGWNRTHMARELGVSVRTLQGWHAENRAQGYELLLGGGRKNAPEQGASEALK